MNRLALVGCAAMCLVLSTLGPAGAEPKKGADPHAGHAHAGHEHVHAEVPAKAPLSGASVYQIGTTWTNQHGKEAKLGELKGRIVVLAMVYTHCQHACPRIVADMRRIRAEFDGDAAAGKDLAFVLVSIDPERDTVKRLKAFGEETGLTEQGWWLLRGRTDDVRELAAVLGVQYTKTTDTDYAHSNIVSVLDRGGEIAHRQEGLGVAPDETVRVIKKLQAASAPPKDAK